MACFENMCHFKLEKSFFRTSLSSMQVWSLHILYFHGVLRVFIVIRFIVGLERNWDYGKLRVPVIFCWFNLQQFRQDSVLTPVTALAYSNELHGKIYEIFVFMKHLIFSVWISWNNYIHIVIVQTRYRWKGMGIEHLSRAHANYVFFLAVA